MNAFGNWQEHDVEAHNAKVAAMKTAKAHNLQAGVGEIDLGAGGGVESRHAELPSGEACGALKEAISTCERIRQANGPKVAEGTTPARCGAIPSKNRVHSEDTPSRSNARPARPSYSPKVVNAWFQECEIPMPHYEWPFSPPRRWRFDLAWPHPQKLALEVQGGIFSQGRHNRGAALLKEWEKLNEAAALGWRILYCQPQDLCTLETAELIRRALKL